MENKLKCKSKDNGKKESLYNLLLLRLCSCFMKRIGGLLLFKSKRGISVPPSRLRGASNPSAAPIIKMNEFV
jgi:hypothetical protein